MPMRGGLGKSLPDPHTSQRVSSSLQGGTQLVPRTVQGDATNRTQSQFSAKDGVCELRSKSVRVDTSESTKECASNDAAASGPAVAMRAPPAAAENGEEDFSYGPGIVSRLKNRYLNLAQKEGGSGLRRYGSLEDLLDEPNDRGRATRKVQRVPDAARDAAMKRARSMDSLGAGRRALASQQEKVQLRHVLPRERVVIIEKQNGSCPPKEIKPKNERPKARGLPPPDTVRHTKRIFERTKPPVKAKPVTLTSKKVTPKEVVLKAPKATTKETVKRDNKVNNNKTSVIEAPPPSKKLPSKEVNGQRPSPPPTPLPPSPPPASRRLPKTEDLPSPVKNETVLTKPPLDPFPEAAPSASLLEVIKVAEAQQKQSPSLKAPAPSSPLTTSVFGAKKTPPKTDADGGSTLVFNFSKRQSDTPDYIENDGVDLSKRASGAKFKHEAGYVLMPGYDARSSSTDDDLDSSDTGSPQIPGIGGSSPALVCDVAFEGAGVIINGRSNLQRQPHTKKPDVSFDMASTSIFEYPSEVSVGGDVDVDNSMPYIDSPTSQLSPSIAPKPREELSNGKHHSSPPTNAGGLASYMPSKVAAYLVADFELGVSRSQSETEVLLPTSTREEEALLPAGHARPLAAGAAWSQDTAPDMLF